MRSEHRGLCAITLATGLIAAAPVSAAASGAPPAALGAAAAAVFDPSTGTFLYSKHADERLPVASLVKLMTVRLALESGDLSRQVTVPTGVTALPETKVGLVPGEHLSLQTLLPALMVRSANDAAFTIAVGLDGNEPAFAQSMNTEAARLALTDTHYVNSSGLDAPGQYSSAADVARLAAADLSLPGFAELVDQSTVTVDGRSYRTVNPFLAYYRGATGIKTGFTSSAMFCLAASADRDGRTLIAVVLGEPDWASTDADAGALLDWAFGPAAVALPNAPASIKAPAPAPSASPRVPAPTTAAVPAQPRASVTGTGSAISPPSVPAPLNSSTAPPRPTIPMPARRQPVAPWALSALGVGGIAGLIGLWLRRR